MIQIRVKPPGTEPATTLEHESGPFDIGRAFGVDGVPRNVITADPAVSRNHARIEEISPGTVRVTNTSQRMPVWIGGGTIAPGEERVLPVPLVFKIGDTTVTVERGPSDAEGIAVNTMASLASSPMLKSKVGRIGSTTQDQDPAVLAGWFETLISVQRAPAGSKEFYQQTATALVEQIGMDVGLVLLHKGTTWTVTARQASAADDSTQPRGREFSTTVLDHLAKEKRTIFQSDDIPSTESLVQVKALVASPVLLPNGDVAGALYGVRRTPRGRGMGISPLEAQLVQVLATAVGIGLARVAAEEETARLRVQLHQQFNDRLANELEADLGRLDPQDREISILFADIRGFSRISEHLGPAETFRFVSDVMEALTESVKRHDGAIMDYVGDEMIALWNAPADHVEHARLAVDCALDLSGDLAAVNATWEPLLGMPVSIGIGLNSGSARVGNTGTRSKPKYGALGHTVNVASRVQGATKAFKCPILLTGGTRDRLPADAAVRRLGKVKVVGINDPVELFQPLGECDLIPADVLAGYEQALMCFERGDLLGTQESLAILQATAAGMADGATLQLAERVQQLVQTGETGYSPVIELSSK